MVLSVYSQYFRAEGTCNGTPRRAALVSLQSDSEAGHIKYSVNITLFPFRDDSDYAVTYDAFASETLYDGKGRRSKKKEAAYMEGFRERINALAAGLGGRVLWDKPLKDAKWA